VRKQNRWKEAAAKFNKAAEASKKAGIQFAYHNHHFEFVKVDGKYAYDILLEETDPKLVQMEMDLCWMNIAGQDPLKYFDRYPGRFPMVHVKDVKKIPPKPDDQPVNFDNVFPEMTSVGNGVIDFKKIFAQSDKAGIKHYFVENDYPKSEFDDIRASYEYLHKLQF
jgi:sugar phosphate isomerase/epimerase